MSHVYVYPFQPAFYKSSTVNLNPFIARNGYGTSDTYALALFYPDDYFPSSFVTKRPQYLVIQASANRIMTKKLNKYLEAHPLT